MIALDIVLSVALLAALVIGLLYAIMLGSEGETGGQPAASSDGRRGR